MVLCWKWIPWGKPLRRIANEVAKVPRSVWAFFHQGQQYHGFSVNSCRTDQYVISQDAPINIRCMLCCHNLNKMAQSTDSRIDTDHIYIFSGPFWSGLSIDSPFNSNNFLGRFHSFYKSCFAKIINDKPFFGWRSHMRVWGRGSTS